MTKSELIQQLCTKFKENGSPAVSCADMREAVDRILGMLADALAAGERIELRGFGSFSLHDIAARQGRNPRTGESVPVPPRKAVYFRASAELRAQVEHG
ncbi:Integration host factor subunit beta [Acidithiobacillus ferrivorans]|uniref:Integration host factor subunit beta n=1 Tax=Acidithiobacillus ferrivorans TaxID=160808 RepID=A0A060UQA8_9PROT|nr:HU family DNA-binding protein [Acidithiobacillus ferrivorans]CDQ10446.1 Integration host factor subunit beta [Acidithiobacillus ferrivorans]SMH64473.1 Integration host factor subunit beta [Acidithiobacillus ferrivorans]